jgi:hypothetical protein
MPRSQVFTIVNVANTGKRLVLHRARKFTMAAKMNKRKPQGATLALVVAASIFIVLLGIGLFFLARILAGERELQNATDSGTLNVGKQSIVRPNVILTPAEETNFRLLTEVVDGRNVVDLKVYNRLIGQALLVGFNASVDRNQQGKDNAATLFEQIQGDGGVGDRLATALGASSAAESQFMPLGWSNSLRMLSQNTLSSNNQHFAVAWMEQRASDIGATNLTVPEAEQIPTVPRAAFISPSFTTADPVTHKQFLRGYRALTFDLGTQGLRPLVGVPVQPDKQPHLVAYKDFDPQIQPPAIVSNRPIHFPPNAFQTSGRAKESVTSAMAVANARSLVSVLGDQYKPMIPGGYLLVQNGPSLRYTGTAANFNTVLNGQLDGGILVNPQGYFSSQPGLIGAWADHNSRHRPRRPLTDGPAIEDLFDRWGNPVDRAEAHRINSPANLVCNDHNTHVGGGGNRRCHQMLNSFEKAYSPGFDGNYQQPLQGTSTNLTAIESLKADLEHLFNQCGVLHPSNSLVSGMRWYKYPCQGGSGPADCPWPQNATTPGGLHSNFPQISSDGTLRQLVSQASGDLTGDGNGRAVGSVRTVKSFLKQRLAQISGKNSRGGLDDDVNYVMNVAQYPMGSRMFIYYTFPQGQRPQVHVSAVAPTSVTDQTPDGTAIPFSFAYQRMIGSKINSTHEHLVDKNPFQYWRGTIVAQEQLVLQPSSGFNNLLGTITMQEQAIMRNNPYFCEPD